MGLNVQLDLLSRILHLSTPFDQTRTTQHSFSPVRPKPSTRLQSKITIIPQQWQVLQMDHQVMCHNAGLWRVEGFADGFEGDTKGHSNHT